MDKFILSVDPGIRNLGLLVGLVKNKEILPILANVVDVYEGKKSMHLIEIAESLHNVLFNLDKTLTDNKIQLSQVLIESQDGKRSCTNYGVMMMINYHYASKKIPVHVMSAKLKNTITLDSSIKLDEIKKKYKNPYDAYKKFAGENAKKYFAKYPAMISKIDQSSLHHIGDAALQLHAYIFKNK